ncbi:hypothetical protein CJU94_35315 (plasmid) [Paraburkholderia aromaticivorans]|uniref:Uncharacterized protein n=1 Tax=Paraburkholderia aromaticivorans TaxID=2026199 RepID=A0A248VX51_9BURK|nr:hypothetical protein CJU94_35315 [Paraburkholderia aromaticivorans]
MLALTPADAMRDSCDALAKWILTSMSQPPQSYASSISGTIFRRLQRLIGADLLCVSACTTDVPHGDRTLLEFLRDGTTSREEVILRLGQPSATFEGERIVTYRVGSRKNEGYTISRQREHKWETASDTWVDTHFSLVLVFDDAGVLKKHALGQVR